MQVAKTKTVSVNMAVGHLVLYPNKTYDFKTSGSLNLNEQKLKLGGYDMVQNLGQADKKKDLQR